MKYVFLLIDMWIMSLLSFKLHSLYSPFKYRADHHLNEGMLSAEGYEEEEKRD